MGEDLGNSFFEYYGKSFSRRKPFCSRKSSLIALAVSHAVQCSYFRRMLTLATDLNGITKEEMMEAVHVTAAIKGGFISTWCTNDEQQTIDVVFSYMV
jgi:alkylhydroperoxidase/carboxymuconolactone decarboxylase family protein YurZ